ncbi:MAG: helix-turn-helix domain-containing protein, partial [Candidatus Obscuribacterales bacterium]|nr:helix-turn-helix domain-containing protein [Candidatus Obscuribacterales bacterium]
QWRQTVMGGIRRGLVNQSPLLFVAMSDEKIKVRDLRNGDWYWVNKALLEEYGERLKPIGIAIYNCLAAHANQEGFCFPSHKHIANKIGASISSVQRGIRQLIKLNLIRKGRQRYHNLYYLLKLDRSHRPTPNQIGQSDRHIGHTDRSDQSAGTTNKNKEKDLNKKNYARDQKTVDNLEEMKKVLVDKMSMNGRKKHINTAIEGP